jgi:hypothetical protein
MTSIAVTASVCASASEAALLVASFMPFSLAHDPPKCERFGDKIMRLKNRARERALGMTHRCARARSMVKFLLGTPHDEYSLGFESPLGEYRLCQGRSAIRRQFGSRAADLCACDGILIAASRVFVARRIGASGCSGIGRRIFFEWNLPFERPAKSKQTQGEPWPG